GAPKCRVKSRRACQKNGGMEAGPGTCNPDPCGGATATSSTSTTTTSTSTTSTTSTTVPPCGTFLLKWGGPVDGELYYPLAVATDGSGNVYVADSRFSRIQKFDANGTFLTAWGQFGNPTGLATDGSGHVYVAEYFNDRIQKFDASGTLLAIWGSPGSGNGQFSAPSGVATDGSGNVYVADAVNSRIQKFDANGTFLATLGSEGDAIGVATDGSGNVDVLEQAQHYVNYETGEDETVGHDRVEKFDASGALVATWGSSGHGNGQFWYPSAVATDASGNVYVADKYNYRIQKFACP